LIIFSLLIIFLTGLIYSRFHLKRKTNKLLQTKNKELEISNTKLSKSKQNLKEINTTKDKFFSIIAHDLKNPFQALLGISELLYTNANELSKEKNKEYSKYIYESSQKLFNLLQNLLQWSKSQLGNIKYSPTKVNIKEIVSDVILLLEMTSKDKQITITNNINDNTTAFADKNIVSLVIRNLISNAIKFSYTKGDIYIYSETNKNNIIVAVEDYGEGIKEENLPKLFDIGLSYSTKGTANEEGTGLGLVLCKELIENSGGKIWVDKNKEKSSIFKFSLPKN
jgi:signal transduction histidine kinase